MMASNLAATPEDDEVGSDNNVNDARSLMVMKVFAKYSSLNEQIERTRKEMKATEMERESVQEEIQRVRQDRINCSFETEEARQEIVMLAAKVQEAKEELCEIEHEIGKAHVDKTKAESELEGVKNFIKNHRQSVIAASEDFRATCQRLQAQVVSESITQQALAVVLPIESYGSQDNDDPLKIPVDPKDFTICSKKNFAYPSSSSAEQDEIENVISWSGLAQDKELRKLFKSYTKKGKQHDKASNLLQDSKQKHAAAEEIAKGQRTRKEQLQKQLKRLEVENCDLQRQILELGGSTLIMDMDPHHKESLHAGGPDKCTKSLPANLNQEELGHHADASSQQQTSATIITPSNKENIQKADSHHRLRKKTKRASKDNGSRMPKTVIHNPYNKSVRKRSDSSNNRPLNEICNNTQSTKSKKSIIIKPVSLFGVSAAPSTTPDAYDEEEQQHPHLGGSLRVDPKFIPNIDITNIGGLMRPRHATAVPESQRNDDAKLSCHKNITRPIQEWSQEIAASKKLRASVEEENFSGMDRRAHSSSFLDDDDDDDDDDDLLALPMMFSRKPTKNI